MNIQKFTQKSIESVNKSSAIATEYGNQEVDQEHLLLALLTIDESLIAELIEKMGISRENFTENVRLLIERKPKVSGSVQQLEVYAPSPTHVMAHSCINARGQIPF